VRRSVKKVGAERGNMAKDEGGEVKDARGEDLQVFEWAEGAAAARDGYRGGRIN